MNTNQCRCTNCGKPLCRDVYQRLYARWQQELSELLTQPVVDRQRVAFLLFLISTLDERFRAPEEKAS
jgi:hypothetical protein